MKIRILDSDKLEVYDTIAVLGVWDHNIGNISGPYNMCAVELP